jgi:hypothetical protein
MRGIAKLLFGDDADRVLDLFGDDADGFGLAEQARRAGEWCGSVPGGDAGARRGAAHPRARRETVLRWAPDKSLSAGHSSRLGSFHAGSSA